MEYSHSFEFDKESPYPVICLMDSQLKVTTKGGTMRLGAYPAKLLEGSRVSKIYGENEISERHRHRYEFNNDYREQLAGSGLTLSGISIDGKLVEVVEVPAHPWFFACQFHPEFTSTPRDGHPLFTSFIEAARAYQSGALNAAPAAAQADA
jgi:CTP synthase